MNGSRIITALTVVALCTGCSTGGTDADDTGSARGEGLEAGSAAVGTSVAPGAEVFETLDSFAFWGEDSEVDVHLYPEPIPVETVARAAEVPRADGGTATSVASARSSEGANEAVRLSVLGSRIEKQVLGREAPEGQAFLVIESDWENIHPRRMVDRAQLEGQVDRTMGVGGLAGGGRAGGEVEYVEMDVAYQVPRVADHLYALADGVARSVHEISRELPGGVAPGDGFQIAEQGDVRRISIAFLIPENVSDLALQFFDYTYGSIMLPLQGDAERARGSGATGGTALARVDTDLMEVAADRLDFRAEYAGEAAPAGWRYAVVGLTGRSKSGRQGQGDIVQFDPTENLWLVTDGGYVHYAASGSTDENGMIRFTPEVFQQQEVAILIPEDAERFRMGLRVRNDVVTMELTRNQPSGLPQARQSHTDGDAMEVLLFGHRTEGEMTILDLGIRPLIEGRGLEVRPAQQFFLITDGGEARVDASATGLLSHGISGTIVVPPNTPVRFEVAYRAGQTPTAVRVRGFRSEGSLTL